MPDWCFIVECTSPNFCRILDFKALLKHFEVPLLMLDNYIAGHPSVLWSRPLRLRNRKEVRNFLFANRHWEDDETDTTTDTVTRHRLTFSDVSLFLEGKAFKKFQIGVPGRLVTRNKLIFFENSPNQQNTVSWRTNANQHPFPFSPSFNLQCLGPAAPIHLSCP